ncbi:MAG: TlpA family protein disulfide reductase [Bacteriovorax sp.]|jgi:cytochrome c biogenesis protein CcmG/thiol:disulfide interchange protein DsbE|nr:TlpA family protein disulfide reductase [Bacteriovorax sp.]
MRLNSFFSKIVIILLVLMLTALYALYEKKKYYTYDDHLSNELFLKKLPDFKSLEMPNAQLINSYDLLKESSGLFVHIWGTWCAPCEKEMPEFLKYAQSVEGKGVRFVLVAVNDNEVKVKKFMERFALPSNVKVVLDHENKVMDLFGTLKVPETFLFDATGKHVNKFIGPQEWGQESYQTRLEFWLNTQNYVDRKIETH